MMTGKLIVPDGTRLDPIALGRQEAAKILEKLKPTADAYQCAPTDVIVIQWIREMLGVSQSIVASEQTKKEDLYQGKVGLVIKLGSHAFVDDGDMKYHDFRPKVGDWVQFRASDGDGFGLIPAGTMDMYHAKRLWCGHVTAILVHPGAVW